MAVEWSGVENVVRQAEEQGTLGAALVAPNGERYRHNAARPFRAASTVKIPLMVEVLRQVERGAYRLDDRHILTREDKAAGSGVLLHLHDGMELTLYDLLYLMISISDNSATNILIRKVGMNAVNESMRELGMAGSNLSREMKGRPAIEGERENFATADDYVSVVQAILDGRAASPASCAEMVGLLEKQQNSRRIARYLPEDERVKWGSKTGSIKGVTNDVGFITVAGRTLILAIFCEGFPDQHIGEQVIGDISRAAVAACGLIE